MASAAWFSGFDLQRFTVASGVSGGIELTARVSSDFAAQAHKPALLLVHGFPQTHVMWQRVAQQLAPHFRIVMPDLRGYGDSARPPTDAEHSPYSKRAMAQDLVALMRQLGCERFFLAGHDRGGRVAHRLALDHPAAVAKLCVIDIAPTLDMYAATDFAFAKAYYHWFHLITPAPLAERMIGGLDPDADPSLAKTYLHTKLGGWGGAGNTFIEPEALAEYERCFCRAANIHAACEDYRAAAGIDLEHDRASREAGEKVQCDLHVLWGERGVVHKLFKPLELWQAQCAGTVTGLPMPAGHFIPEELPEATADALRAFCGSA